MSPAQAQHIHELIASLRLAQARERGELVRRAALALGKTPKTVYRMLKAAGWDAGRKPRADAGQTAVDASLALTVGGLVTRATRVNGKRTLTIKDACERLAAQGYGVKDDSTGETIMPSPKTVSTAMRRYGCHPDQMERGKATGRQRSLHPNHVWEIDASVCVLVYLPGGKKMRLLDEKIYNERKPGRLVEIGRQRIIRYVVVDHCTHTLYLHYELAGGEDAAGILATLIEAMSDRGPRDPMHGVPFILYMDKSGGNQSSLVKGFCEAMGIKPMYHAAGNASATGSVEVAQNLVERGFESRLRFMDVSELGQLQEQADRWRRHFNAHSIHTRLQCPRNRAWLRISDDQLRVASREAMQAVATWGEQTRTVQPDYTIRLDTKSHGVHTYDLRMLGAHGVHVRDKVGVLLNPFNAPEIIVTKAMPDGENLRFTVSPIDRDEWGFDAAAPVMGQEWGKAPETPVEQSAKAMEALAIGEDGKAERPWEHIDPMADIKEAPLHLRREGVAAPVGGEAGAPVALAMPLSRVEAAQRLQQMDPAPWQRDPIACMAHIRDAYGDEVQEAALEGIAAALRDMFTIVDVPMPVTTDSDKGKRLQFPKPQETSSCIA